MCGRFVDPNLRGTEDEHSEIKISPIPQRFNVKPTNPVLIYRSIGAYARWWLVPPWHHGALKDWKATSFNARIEDAATKPTFRDAWARGRCLIPMAGYYEWKTVEGRKLPHFIHAAGNAPTLWAAGLASQWRDQLTCTMMTRAANAQVSDIHHRMPVVLNIEERDAWLSGSEDLSLGAGTALATHQVHPFGRDDDDETLIEPV